MPIQVHLFLGYRQEGELAFHLSQSQHWKKEKTTGSLGLLSLGLLGLTETSWQNQTYLGLFVPPLVTCSEIIKKKQEIKNHLQLYCPKLNLDLSPAYLFPQVLVF